MVSVSLLGSATPEIYTEVGFADESSPRHFGFYNTEVLQPRFDNSFYLGYKNVYDLSITDGYTGEVLLSNLSTDDSFIRLNKSTYEFKKNRDYYIKYKVVNSYYIDNILSDSSYYSKIVFDATPNATMNYEIIYESSIYENSTPLDLNFGQTSSLLDKGYVIASNATYDFDRIKVVVSPGYILDDGNDYITISIISLDTEGNPKPYQSFTLYSLYHSLTFDSPIITTDDEGFASVNAVYDYGYITHKDKAMIAINGAVYPSNPFAHPDSDNAGFGQGEWISVYSSKVEDAALLASANPSIINADGVSSTAVSGILTANNAPSKNSVVYWRKSRYLYSTLNDISYSTSTLKPDKNSISGIVYTDDNGKFEIGPIPSQERATPGYWFMAVDSELSSTPSLTPNTSVGDVLFWYESYDNVDINYVPGLKIPDIINYDINKSLNIYSTPTFRISYYNENIVDNTGSTPRWTPPQWLPIPRYDQYQAGYFGATPYVISDYSNLIKDYED
jgi:hypothetical protein